MRNRTATLIGGRRENLARILGRQLSPPAGVGTTPEDVRRHLVEEAEELYQNELEWEHLTGEEGLDEHALPEMAFPGFLAFIRGLLLSETLPDAKAPAEPRPDVVEDILRFLASRMLEIEETAGSDDEEEAERMQGELSATSRLLNLVLYRLHGLTPADVERVEAAQVLH